MNNTGIVLIVKILWEQKYESGLKSPYKVKKLVPLVRIEVIFS